MASPRAVPAKTLGARAMDVAFKAFTGTLFAATVVTGGWFAATSASAVGHYDRLAKEAEKRREEEAREAAKRREEEERRKKSAWRLFG
jgi:ribosomal protein L12E/L44/L45/RPP1/RPP2